MKQVTTDILNPSFRLSVPEDDDRERSICTRCGFVDYKNPKVVVGAVATDDQARVLLCKRAIEPQSGLWTIPAGYLELGESPEEGARREAREEAGADLEIDQLLAVYAVPRISQVQLIYRARLANPSTIAPGPESETLKLIDFGDIPWTELAFPSAGWALRDWESVKQKQSFVPFGNPVSGS